MEPAAQVIGEGIMMHTYALQSLLHCSLNSRHARSGRKVGQLINIIILLDSTCRANLLFTDHITYIIDYRIIWSYNINIIFFFLVDVFDAD